MKIFFGFSFRDNDKELVGYVESVLAGHPDIQVLNGERAGGEQLTPKIQQDIEDSDGLIALLTRRDLLSSGQYTTHPWVKDELGHARTLRKKAIALVESGVDMAGMEHAHEHLRFDRDAPLAALLGLAETIGKWKGELGRTVKVGIRPQDLAREAGLNDASVQCLGRLWRQGQPTDWKQLVPVPEVGGTFVYIEGVRDDHLVQLKVVNGTSVWQSPASSQWIAVELERWSQDR